MSYPAIGDYNGGVCPKSHPVAIFSAFYEFHFDVSPFPDIDRFAFANGDPTGYGFHGDYMYASLFLSPLFIFTFTTGWDGPTSLPSKMPTEIALMQLTALPWETNQPNHKLSSTPHPQRM